MSKRILTDNIEYKQISGSPKTIRTYGGRVSVFKGLYAVIIADDNIFEGL